MKILFGGCSMVQGVGLPGQDKDPDHFANIVGRALGGEVTNVAIRGNSNDRIFTDTCLELTRGDYDMVFVGWTSYPRYVFWPGLETYECRRSMTPAQTTVVEHRGNDIYWSQDELNRLQEWFMTVNHDHYSILDICRYTNVLVNLSKIMGFKLYFINSLNTWDTGYFEQFDRLADVEVRPDLLTAYTNQLLISHNRDDNEINQLFHIMRQDYAQVGGIHADHWINLYQSMESLTVDLGIDPNQHPGLQSHRRFAQIILDAVQ